jgi:hypothetical protein
MPSNVGISEAIDGMWEAGEKGPRPHLGASQIGKPCDRALVYGFRHAVRKRTKGRMLRLFRRGHMEEISLVAMLRDIGFEVREVAERLCYHDMSGTYFTEPWDSANNLALANGTALDVSDSPEHMACAALCGVRVKQWNFADVGGHFAGSTDGMAMNPRDNLRQFPAIPPDTWFGLEFKTYNAKSFEKLAAAREVRAVKPEHYSQMQVYMHYMGLPLCLYMAVCKNDDQLYDEVVSYDPAEAQRCIERARVGVAARQLPRRLHENSTHFDCKYCDYKGPCHFGEDLLKSCRTCRHVAPVTEGTNADWYCTMWSATIPKAAVKLGCDRWAPLTD